MKLLWLYFKSTSCLISALQNELKEYEDNLKQIKKTYQYLIHFYMY